MRVISRNEDKDRYMYIYLMEYGAVGVEWGTHDDVDFEYRVDSSRTDMNILCDICISPSEIDSDSRTQLEDLVECMLNQISYPLFPNRIDCSLLGGKYENKLNQ